MSRNTPDSLQKQPPMAQGAVLSFVSQAMSQFPPESLCFYLPQLVQALRHDVSGKLQEYVILLCSRNILLTHQLLWWVCRRAVTRRALITESETEIADKSHHGFSGNPVGQRAARDA